MSMVKKILIIEDETSLAELIKLTLEKDGYETVLKRSARGALEYLSGGDLPALIWLDHRLLGNENGLDFLRIAKEKNIDLKSVPIFVVATIMTENDVREYVKLGVKNYYLKSEQRLGKIIEDLKEYLK